MADGNIMARKTQPTVRAATWPTRRVWAARVLDEGLKYLRMSERETGRWMMSVSRTMYARAAQVGGRGRCQAGRENARRSNGLGRANAPRTSASRTGPSICRSICFRSEDCRKRSGRNDEGCCLVGFFPVGQSRSRVRRGCPPRIETPRPRPQLSSCAVHRWSFWTSSPWVPRSPLCHSSDPPVPLHGQPRRRCRRRLRSLLEATHACSASAPECSVCAKPHRRSIRRELPG